MKFFVTLLILAAIISAGFAYQLLFGQPDKDSNTSDMATTAEPKEVIEPELPLSGVGTLQSLLDRKANIECQITYDSPEYETDTEGTYFVSDDKIRGDFIIPAPELGTQVVSSIIIDETTMYYWSVIDGESFGFTSSRAGAQSPQGVEKQEPVPMDNDVRYVCKPWVVVDGSIFVPPSDVTFQDFSALMEAGMEYGTP